MATPTAVRALFEERLKEGIPNPPGEFHPADLERVKDDKYLKRLLQHHDDDVKAAADMLWDILVWRKFVSANEINETNIRMDYIKEGAFFPHGRDVDGNLLFIFKSKLYVKGDKDYESLKKLIIYWFDRIEREENGKPITLFFDMEGCGLSNMDMELIKYFILLMKQYYPYFLHYIIIYQMPWVLSAAFKVVKSLLPAKAIERMKFASKDTLKNFVLPEQALTCWGGKDTYVFEFVPENKNITEHNPKKVTFSENSYQHSPGEMLQLVPNDFIIFKNENGEMCGQFTLTNMDESAISFKIRTTSPEKFRVRPSSGTLVSGASQVVMIVVQSGFHLRAVSKDRFLVMATQIPKTDLSASELSELWQKAPGSKIDEYRLKCQLPEQELRNGGTLEGSDKPDPVTMALNNLQKNYENLHKQVKMLKMFQFITLWLTVVAIILGYLIYKKSDNDRYCDRI